jgi:hypothetical protein
MAVISHLPRSVAKWYRFVACGRHHATSSLLGAGSIGPLCFRRNDEVATKTEKDAQRSTSEDSSGRTNGVPQVDRDRQGQPVHSDPQDPTALIGDHFNVQILLGSPTSSQQEWINFIVVVA